MTKNAPLSYSKHVALMTLAVCQLLYPSLSRSGTEMPGQGLGDLGHSSVVPDACESTLCPIVEVQVRSKSNISSGENRLQVCTKSVQVPKDIFDAINSFMRGLQTGSSSGGLPPNLTPAQQTILLMYATFLQQTTEFNCPN